MKKIIIFGLVAMVILTGFCFGKNAAVKKGKHRGSGRSRGSRWKLGPQAYSFKKFTFYEAIDKAEQLGLHYIEAYPGQKVSKERMDVKTGPDMSEEVRAEVKQKLKDAKIKLINFGVTKLTSDEAQCRKVFEFAKDMGIETIVSEPPEDAFDLIDKLCNEYNIKVAIHNHPKPSHYWNPDTVLKVCEGRSKMIGACADTGHWMRSGLNPLEAVKKLEGRIVSFHLKDLNEFGVRSAHDVPWGTGKADIKAILTELARQRFRGSFSIEYEHNWEDSVPEIQKCVDYFKKTAAKLRPSRSKSKGPRSRGMKDLFAKDFSNAVLEGKWAFEDGVLTRKGGGDIWTKDKYGDFVLKLEFKVAEGTNSGVFIRTGDYEWLPWIEIQIEDSSDKPISNHICGGIFDIIAPSKNMVKKPGLWNEMTIVAKGKRIIVVLNDEKVVDMDLNDWDTAHKNPDGTKNKFDIAYKDLPRSGFIGLQDHGRPIWYRNVKIKTF